MANFLKRVLVIGGLILMLAGGLGDIEKSNYLGRGINVHPWPGMEDLKVLKSWGVNLLRLQYYQKAWRYGLDLDGLERHFQMANSLGLRTIVALAPPPEVLPSFWSNPKAQEDYKAIWRKVALVARPYKPAGYDLFNEPKTSAAQWNDYVQDLADSIVEVDSETPFVVQPVLLDRPQVDSIAELRPLRGHQVFYSVHIVEPMPFTNQTISGRPGGLSYPGRIEGIWWDKETLAGSLAPVRAFQQRYGVPIYVGEFSAVWQDQYSKEIIAGSYQYIRDGLELFEAFGWSWSYHAFREWYLYPSWTGFSLEHGPGDRLQFLLEYWKK